jgi:hypothetical protein
MRLTFIVIRTKTLWLLLREDRTFWLILLRGLVLHLICSAHATDLNGIKVMVAQLCIERMRLSIDLSTNTCTATLPSGQRTHNPFRQIYTHEKSFV